MSLSERIGPLPTQNSHANADVRNIEPDEKAINELARNIELEIQKFLRGGV